MKKLKYKTIDDAKSAVKKLGINTRLEYLKRYKEDPLLPSSPQETYPDEWLGWSSFFGRKKKEFYRTLEDAANAARKLGLKSPTDYEKCYSQDPLLPSRPSQFYESEWISWSDFLDNIDLKKNFYPTMEEATNAVKKLGIKSQAEYFKRYKEDSRLPGFPPQMYLDLWEGWPTFLGKNAKAFYNSISEAANAARKLGITTASDYERLYQKDKKLPSKPRQYYQTEWISWMSFLGKEYSSVEEVSAAVATLGITDLSNYRLRYKEDPKLPRSITKTFGANSWKLIFPSRLYSSYEEASNAALSLGINSYECYKKKHHFDPSLPSSPNQFYSADWVNWYAFLGKVYPTAEEALLSAKKAKVRNYKDYSKLRLIDKALPANPVKVYKFKNFKEFMNFESYDLEEVKKYCAENRIKSLSEYKRHVKENSYLPPTRRLHGYVDGDSILYKPSPYDDCDSSFAQWIDHAKTWALEGRGIPNKIEVTKKFLVEILAKFSHPTDPKSFFHSSHDAGNINDIARLFSNSHRVSNCNYLIEFLNYVLLKTCATINPETGEITVPPIYQNPYQNQIINFEKNHRRPSETVKPILPFHLVVKAKDWLAPATATHFGELTNAISLLDSDWFDAPPNLVDKSDPNCVWRINELYRSTGRRKEPVLQIWSPVRTIAMFLLLSVPARGQQILWLDSGEGDEIILKYDDLKSSYTWVKNTGPLSGALKRQSFLRRFANDEIGIYFTTNKTGEQIGGYEVPYVPEDIIRWVVMLRDWQTKYNPLNAPTPWTETKMKDKKSRKILKSMGCQTFLFRDASAESQRGRSLPLTTQIAFKHLFPAILYHIQSSNIQLATNDSTNLVLSEYRSAFSPHSLRASLITSLILDGRVAVPIVSKLVGHHQVVMTIYYTKVSQGTIRRELETAEKNMLSNSANRLNDLLLENKISEALTELIATDGSALKTINSEWPKAAYTFMDWGLCPYSGSRCGDGGELMDSGKVYAPVVSGYLGRRNCLRCRFFMTGPAFIGGLKTLVDEISFECSSSSKQMDNHLKTIKSLEEEEFDLVSSGKPFTKKNDLLRCQNLLAVETEKFDNLSIDLISAIKLAQQSMKLARTSNQESNTLLLICHDEHIEIAMETVSEFRQLQEICENAKFYRSANPSKAVAKRSQMIDLMSKRNNLTPMMYTLSHNDQLLLGTQLVELLKLKLGSWNQVDSVVDGTLSFSDVFKADDLLEIKHDINALFINQSLTHQTSN